MEESAITSRRKKLAALFAAAALASLIGCSAGLTILRIHCGPGTYDNTTDNACELDPFEEVRNPPHTYWNCQSLGSTSNRCFVFLQAQSEDTSGSGTDQQGCGGASPPPAISFLWDEIGSEIDGIQLTNPASPDLAPYLTLTQIVPNGNDNNATAFTAVGFSCSLTSGSIPAFRLPLGRGQPLRLGR